MARGIHMITMPVRGDGKGDNVLAHAARLAHRFVAHVRVIHCRPKAEDMMPFGVVIPSFMRKQIEEVAQHNSDSEENALRQEFTALAAALALPVANAAPGTVSAGFVEYAGKQIDAVQHFGRVADLICVPKPDRVQNLGMNTLKSALYSSGRPVLMCPDTAPSDTLGDHVAIAWNGSLEATRAVALAMPVIEAAKKVTILTTGTVEHAATADELQQLLELRKITALVKRFETKGNIGRMLLEQCNECGADLLVMGAYHERYERETLFGGNTQAVVDHATIPVVLVH